MYATVWLDVLHIHSSLLATNLTLFAWQVLLLSYFADLLLIGGMVVTAHIADTENGVLITDVNILRRR